jgi:hypothetical protein
MGLVLTDAESEAPRAQPGRWQVLAEAALYRGQAAVQ